MARKFYFQVTVPAPVAKTARLGADNTAGGRVSELDIGKLVKLAGESRYDLAAAGDDIEGQMTAYEPATSDGYSIGSITDEGRMQVIFDGLQATAGTGVVAIGDFVVVGTPVAKGTKQASWPKVCKATSQGSQKLRWRVISLGTAGTGAVGTTGLIERV